MEKTVRECVCVSLYKYVGERERVFVCVCVCLGLVCSSIGLVLCCFHIHIGHSAIDNHRNIDTGMKKRIRNYFKVRDRNSRVFENAKDVNRRCHPP